jgi:hyperosmotically inducible protein
MNASRTHLAALSLIAAATLLVACEKRTTETPAGAAATNAMTATGKAVERAADKTADAVGDAAITGKVKSALIADPDVKALKIDVDTSNGVVMLNGSADSAAHSDKATTVAQGVDGVKSVENHLTVKP